MSGRSKQAVTPYEALIAFANAPITPSNWDDVRGRLRSSFLSAPTNFKGGRIRGPEPLQEVQRELRTDLFLLTHPEGEIGGNPADWWAYYNSVGTEEEGQTLK